MANLPPIRFAELAAALLPSIDSLLAQWLPGGALKGTEYFVHSVWRSERSPSLSVCVKGSKAGMWADHGGDQRGNDLLSLYAAIHGISNGRAALDLARQLGLEDVAGVRRQDVDAASTAPRPTPRIAPVPAAPLPAPKPQKNDEGWCTVRPVPEYAPPATFWHQYRQVQDIVHTAAYVADGVLHGYVVRFATSDGGKETLPYTWCTSARDGASKWVWRTWDEPRPLYYPGGVSPQAVPLATVVLVEGERKAQVLQDLLTAGAPGVYVVASWAGGCKAWRKADWAWLAGRHVLLWPDCDGKREPLIPTERKACADKAAEAAAQAAKPLLPPHKQGGMAAMLGIGAHLATEQGCTVSLLPIPAPLAVPDGWDCADAIETDGWGFDRVLTFFGSAQALPGSADAPAPAKPTKTEGPGGPAGGDGGESVVDKGLPWWLRPYWDSDKGRWLVSRKLVIAALINDPRLAGVLGLNELSNTIEVRLPWPWPHGKAGPLTGSADLLLGQYLTTEYGLPSIPRASLMEAIETVAHSARFHPVRDYLQGLQHDGTARIDKWLIYCLGYTPATLHPHMAEYLALVGRFLLMGMVYRVMEPGCKFDYCMVLEGAGGLGKSTMTQVLASKAFFSGSHFDLSRGNEAYEKVQGNWVYELQELSSFGKAEINLIKAFISNESDRYRPSYGRVAENFRRQCVLIGTTNEDRYLRDRTGNRRWWPVPVKHRIKIDWLGKMRDQLLAEAYALYLQAAPYTPTPEQEARLFAPMQESRLEETVVQSALLAVLTRDPSHGLSAIVNNLADFVTNAQLVESLGADPAKSGPALVREIGSWMKHEGWELKKRTINGARVLGYVRPPKWPNDPIQGAAGDVSDWTSEMAATVASQAEPGNQSQGDEYAAF